MIEILFPIALTIIAILYSAVGQAGGTGYVALMGLAGFAPSIIKNLMNSAAALAGAWVSLPLLPNRLPIWVGLCRIRRASRLMRGRASP